MVEWGEGAASLVAVATNRNGLGWLSAHSSERNARKGMGMGRESESEAT